MADQPTVYVTREIPDVGLELLREECEVHVWDGKLPPSKEHIIETLADLEADAPGSRGGRPSRWGRTATRIGVLERPRR